MKFDYELYHPKKVMKDIVTSVSGYYKSKDVHVSPMTKIGDLTEMPKKPRRTIPDRISRRKPVFTRNFDRGRLAFKPVFTNNFDRGRLAFKPGSRLRSSINPKPFKEESWFKGLAFIHYTRFTRFAASGALALALGIIGGGMHLFGGHILNMSTGSPSQNIKAADSSDTVSSKTESKAHPIVNKSAAKPSPSPTPVPTPAVSPAPSDDAAGYSSDNSGIDSQSFGPGSSPSQIVPAPSPAQNPTPSPSPIPAPTPSPTPSASPSPSPSPSPTPAPTPSPTPDTAPVPTPSPDTSGSNLPGILPSISGQ